MLPILLSQILILFRSVFCRMPGSQNGRSSSEMRPIKTETIHSCARNGYLHGLERMLQENPSLLNARDSVMRETPLHVASAKNYVDGLKYLLDWTGPEMAELEARNTYGETPLHVAIKNSCCESAKLLIQHGAALEAKADNGMTPLHLAVWHAIPSGDCTTVSMLLSHNAECSMKDNEGKTPIDHLLAGPTYERLRNLLNQHQLMQRKRKALESCQEAEAMAEFDKSISHVIGLKKMKLQMRKWARGMLLDEKRRAMGLDIEERKVPHMAFLGNPGTGKTMVAHILGKLLHHVGILPSDRVTVVQRTDLVGEFVGHTGPKTRRKIKEAEGGILFVDEAYRLIPMQKSDDKDYGIEALEEIMSVMDEGKVIVIFAGYREPMKRVIDANEGFRRRVEKFFYFDDFTPLELAEILHLKMHCLKGYKLHQCCTIHALARLIEKETTEKLRKEWNGGLIIPWLKNARDNLDERLDFDVEDTEVMVTITLGDLEKGLHQISEESPDEVWRV
ncbi:uncharacterized protein LOC144571683 isoform X1 [Carex rostrata]